MDISFRYERRYVKYICYAAFGVYGLFSFLFYIERICFADASFITYYILERNDLFIQVNRYGSAITQAIPLLCSRLHLPLRQIMMAYSVGFVGFYFVVFVVIVEWFKNEKLGLVLLLALTLLMSDSFYWVMCEMQQGLGFLVLYFGFYLYIQDRNQNGYFLSAIQFLSLIITMTIHPLILFPFLFLTLFLKQENLLTDKRKWIVWMVAGMAIWILKLTVFSNYYDNGKMGSMVHFITLFPNYFTIPSNQQFLYKCLHNYHAFVVLFGWLLIHYVQEKQLPKAMLLFAFVMGYLFLINVSYYKDADRFYMDNNYLILGVFIGTAFAFDILPRLKPVLAAVLVAAILISRLVMIWDAHFFYTERLNWTKNMVAYAQSHGNRKYLIDEKLVPKDKLILTWASPFETLLLSSLDKADAAVTVQIDEDPERFGPLEESEELCFMTFWKGKVEKMPQQYFRLGDGKYQRITKDLKKL